MRSSEAPERAAAGEAMGTEEGGNGDGAGRPPVGTARGDSVGRGRRGSAGERALGLGVRIVVGLAVIGGAVVVAGVLVSNRRQALYAPVQEVVRRVRVVPAVVRPAGEVARVWEGFGTARAMDQADVAAEVGARVVTRPEGIDAGAEVTVGTVLVKLEESDFRERMESAQRAAEAIEAQLEGLDVEEERLGEQVAQAEEQVKLTRWELEQVERARAGAAATELEGVRLQVVAARLEGERLRLRQALDAIPSRRASLRADLSARRSEASVAARQLARTSVTSPISGILQAVDVYVGDTLAPGQRVARVVDLERIEVPLRVPASAYGGIRVGDTATVRAGANGGGAGEWSARVARISPEADPATRTVTVYLEVEQEVLGSGVRGELLLPGRFVSAELAARAGNGEGLILVPRRAVSEDRVWVAVEGEEEGVVRAQPRRVEVRYTVAGSFPELDPDETQWAVIGAGVEAGERVIVTNLDDLAAGVRVEVVEG